MIEVPLLGKFLASTSDSACHLDDVVDRLHQKVTVIVLILCAMFVGAKQQFGEPIQCMLPAHLDRSSWTAYGQYYCFVESTYRLTYNATVPNAGARAKLRATAGVNYYQWVPFFLAIQALCFYVPGWLWTTLQGQRALDMKAVVNESISLKATFKVEDQARKLKNIAEYVASSLKLKMNVRRTKLSRCLLDGINGLSTSIYLTSKFLAMLNDLLQLYIIGRFIGVENFSWALTPLATGKQLLEMSFTSPYFPRVTFCDLDRQTVGNVETNTLQCVLMLNFINEKIFFMLWYWISLLFVISLANFAITLVQCTLARCREQTIKFYLQSGELNEEDCFLLNDQKWVRIYIGEFLGLDGALMLRFINDHAGAIVARDVAIGLWHSFCASYQDSNPYFISREIVANDKSAKVVAAYPPPSTPPPASFSTYCSNP